MENNRASLLLEHICKTIPDPIFLLDENGTYVDIAGGADRTLYDSPGYLKDHRLHDIFPADEADRLLAVVRDALNSNTLRTVEYQLTSKDMNYNPMDGPGGPQWYQGRVYPVPLPGETAGHVIWVAINITEQKLAQIERDRVMLELRQALSEIRRLQGFLPICAHCNKIRDDAGYWQRLEAYFYEHADVKFTHSICPDCARKLYPSIDFDSLLS